MASERSFHRDVALSVVNLVLKSYWRPMWDALEKYPALRETVPGFFVNPEKLVLYVGRHHMGIEYLGPISNQRLEDRGRLNIQVFDYRQNDDLLAEILGIQYEDSTQREVFAFHCLS